MNCCISLILVVFISAAYSASIFSVLKSEELREKRAVNDVSDYGQNDHDDYHDHNDVLEDPEPVEIITTEPSRVKKHLQTEEERNERRKGMPFQHSRPTKTPPPNTTTAPKGKSDFDDDDEEEDTFDGIFTDMDKDDEQDPPGRGRPNNKIFGFGKDRPRQNFTNVKPVSHIYSNKPVIINSKGNKDEQDNEQFINMDPSDEMIIDMKRPMNIWGTKNIIIFNSKIYCRTNSIVD